ncbi:sugar phosphate isomerase (plasmid) [Salipiger sp. CCB-MM3]|uniref:metabolite traffic protein EboE n=1 Tax=Salipiger sp. CCB-MM3 TaxID=1792508 RepID=UPI00080A9716|nr:metabolite traffic protein EboE [Salipiger sp. CCB-MM3]ANT63227.1 sugar phosphate isomerase [Salipiger sp. CCB-MM3]
MQLGNGLGSLTYCLNIHPTETWEECSAALTGPLLAVKEELSPDAPFAVGLRLSAKALEGLDKGGRRAALREFLTRHDLIPLTMNGFPYGPFHGTRVKEQVYQPDWRTEERLAYTNRLTELMAELAEPGANVSLSTVPGTFRTLAGGAEAEMAEHYLRAAAHCLSVREHTGVAVALAIEPEPFCFLETIAGSVDFFENWLYSSAAVARFAELTGLKGETAEEALRRHLGLCYDVCHAAVEYEDAAGSLDALKTAGIPIHKLQLSSALRAAEVSPKVREALQPFSEPTYLHQVLTRRGDGPITAYSDLPEALARGAEADGEEWRIHFHVPVFLASLGLFDSTQEFLKEILDLHRAAPISPHLEVETYTWDVLPPELRTSSVDAAIARELRWVLERLGQ